MRPNQSNPQSPPKATPLARKPYAPPTLTVFGDVAALTQSGTGCNMNDSSGCTVTPGSNMGPML